MHESAPRLFLSHRLDALLDRMIEEFETGCFGILDMRTILVANAHMKQWLLLEIAKRKGVAMGLKLKTVDEVINQKFSSTELFCQIYDSLRASDDPDVLAYLKGRGKRLLSLTKELTTLFLSYGKYGKSLFECKASNWQHALLQKIGAQALFEVPSSSLYLFGIDHLPPIFWDYLFQKGSFSLFLFSPCKDFWEDLSTSRERSALNRYWRKKQVSMQGRQQLDAYMREAPPLLANWGKLGRETLKIFDSYDLEIEEVYPSLEPISALKELQSDLLHFRQTQKSAKDDSVQIFLTGSSRMKEIECLRDEILRLKIPYHEIAVLAPNIEPYVPLIEFVFADIPYRIAGFDVAPQSPFRLGLCRLLDLGRWDAEKVLALFETPSFCRKQKWDEKKLDAIRSLIADARVQWGFDPTHRTELLAPLFGSKTYSHGSWEEGLDRLLESIVYFRPQQINADLFEEFLAIFLALKKAAPRGEKTLCAWAGELEALAAQFLQIDSDNEADQAAEQAFRQFLFDLRNSQLGERLFPFEVIERLLCRPCSGQTHASHLHAIRFAPLEESALFPAKALFLIGMDEESFPRVKHHSSLDLLKKHKIAVPSIADRDRYFFLQALFSAGEFLRISYGHLSPDEGKPVGPSLLVQELLSSISVEPIIYRSLAVAPSLENSFWPDVSQCPTDPLPTGEITLFLSDLRLLARHPWKFYLQKVLGIYLNEEREETFNLQENRLAREVLEKPLAQVFEELPAGLLGEALRLKVEETAAEWQKQLAEWQLRPFTLVFRESCSEIEWDGAHCIAPPIELEWDHGLKVRLLGEITQVTAEGLLCLNSDQIGGLLKSWPEALAAAISLKASHVWMLKTGKAKQLDQPEKQLKAFVEYYFRCLTAPSPLLADWADPLLRKGTIELEKKMKKGPEFPDPVYDWVLARTALPSAEKIVHGWGSYLKTSFAALAATYPTRGKSHADV